MIFLLLSLVCIKYAAAQANVTLQLGNTTLNGVQALGGLGEFYGGIPFAEPPVGQRRLKSPILKTVLNNTVFNASNYGPGCFQPHLDAIEPFVQFSEDCLTINVIRPTGLQPNSSLPVMAWIYGGGFTGGFSLLFPGDALALLGILRGTPIIFVSFNYRLGPLGFPQGAEAQNQSALNLGLQDQIAALEWIQANIGAFGGDRTKVTVFGESAGAISIATHMLKPSFANLARATILESGSAGTVLLSNATRRQSDWDTFVGAVPECFQQSGTNDTFQCLRLAPSESMLKAMLTFAEISNGEQFPWIPTYDGVNGVLPDLPSEIIRRGDFAKIPFIAGTNLDEGTGFTPKGVQSTAGIKSLIVANFTPSPLGPDVLSQTADAFLIAYPDDPASGSPFNTGNNTFGHSSQYKRAATLEGDIAFQSQRRFLQEHATAQGVKNFGYLFTDPVIPLGDLSSPPEDGVAHGSELLYVFGFVAIKDLICAVVPPEWSDVCKQLVAPIPASSVSLSASMVDYWLSFVTSLDPNDGRGSTPNRQNWTAYTTTNAFVLQLNGTNTTMIRDNYRAEQIALINNNTRVLNR
ncbi:hypothetical protein HGRIS_012174 [Hohenbuehelia grisea]|uniref:Carboxylic ester hydrolase n=1 Tax=Hohenbuehelia grisea TaxID=104357 RepID=A0ABR3IRF8_9AGAR